MHATTNTIQRSVADEVIDLYVDDATATDKPGDVATVAGTLAAYLDVFLIGDDECRPADRVAVMTSKIQQAHDLIASLPCLCATATSEDLNVRDDRCQRCRVLGQHTPPHNATDTALTAVGIATRTLAQHGLADDADTVTTVAKALAVTLWRELVGTDLTGAALRAENHLLRQQLRTITQEYHELDPELCQACAVMNNGGPCPFHNGHNSGALYMAEAVGAVCDDLDLADRVRQLVADRDG